MKNSFEVGKSTAWICSLICLRVGKEWTFPIEEWGIDISIWHIGDQIISQFYLFFLDMFKWDTTVLRVLSWNSIFTSIVYEHAQEGPITKPGKQKKTWKMMIQQQRSTQHHRSLALCWISQLKGLDKTLCKHCYCKVKYCGGPTNMQARLAHLYWGKQRMEVNWGFAYTQQVQVAFCWVWLFRKIGIKQ